MFLEPLESRLLLSVDPLASTALAASLDASDATGSTITWDNRGDNGGADTDAFEATYGAALAPTARAIVDRAMDDWEQVILDFNYAGGGNSYSLNVSAADLGDGNRGVTNNISFDGDGKPTSADITMDDAGGTGGWFFDTTPMDDAEFTTLLNAFTANGLNALNGNDFYRTIVHEIGHAMGILIDSSAAIMLFLGAEGPEDPNEPGSGEGLFLFTGASVTATLTETGGGHIYEGPAVAGFTTHPFDLLNAGRTVGFPPPTRELITDLDALILADAYNYSIQLPSTINTFFANFNSTTGELTVNGAPGTSNDQIDIDVGGSLRVMVNGTEEIFDGVLVTSINVLAGAGNDFVSLSSQVGIPTTIDGGDGDDTLIGGDVTITGGAGNDLITGSDGADNLSGGAGNDTIFGLGGNDTISGDDDNDEIHAGTGNNTVSDGTGNDLVDLSENSVAVTYTTGGGNDTVIGTAFNDTITGSSGTDRLEGRGGNDALVGGGGNDQMFGGDDSDTFTWNPGDASDLIEGETGNDVLVFIGSGAPEDFTLSAVGTRLQLLRNVGAIDMDVAGVEQVNLNALADADSATVNDLTGTDVQVVNIDLGVGGDADSATVNGRAVADNLTAAVSGSVVTVTGLNYNVNVSSATTVDTLTVNGNDGDDTIKAVSPIESTIGIVLNGGNGNDFLSADATLNGGDGNDTLVGGAGNDSMTGGDGDDVFLLTANNGGGTDTVDGGNGGDTILIQGGSANDLITLSIATGNLAATIGGVTTIYNLAGSNFEQVVADGGGQISPEGDRVDLIATGGADAIAITGPAVSLGGVTVVSIGVEDFRLDAGGGTDTLTYTGIVGVTESISVAGSPTPNSGKFSVPGVLKLSFTNAELIDVIGNAADNDTLTFSGTNDPDLFQINLAAAGTTADPILKLQTGALAPLLTLRNYTGFQTLNVNGLNGSDTFNVLTSATGPNRNLFVDGDLPAGKKKSTDQLNIFYTPPRPHIIQSGATQDPDAGLVDLDYGTAQYLVQYDGMEEVVIRRL